MKETLKNKIQHFEDEVGCNVYKSSNHRDGAKLYIGNYSVVCIFFSADHQRTHLVFKFFAISSRFRTEFMRENSRVDLLLNLLLML